MYKRQVLGLGACAALLWLAFTRLTDLESRARSLSELGELRSLLARLVSDRDDLDLRRLEHVLVDIRDGLQQVQEQLLRAAESTAVASSDTALPPAPISLGERVTNRLFAMGYERVQIVTDSNLVDELHTQDGEILVEAHRQGVLHKGRVLVQSGRITAVDVHPTYSIFP